MAAAVLLGIIAGGPADSLALVQPLLDSIGARTFPAGPQPSSALLLKLTNNLVLACAIEAMGEAFSLVEKSGADRQVLRDIRTAGLFSCPAYDNYSRLIVDWAYDNVGFTAPLATQAVNHAFAAGDAIPVQSGNEWCRAMVGQ